MQCEFSESSNSQSPRSSIRPQTFSFFPDHCRPRSLCLYEAMSLSPWPLPRLWSRRNLTKTGSNNRWLGCCPSNTGFDYTTHIHKTKTPIEEGGEPAWGPRKKHWLTSLWEESGLVLRLYIRQCEWREKPINPAPHRSGCGVQCHWRDGANEALSTGLNI